MRLSTNEKDPGFREWCRIKSEGKEPKVLLDGVEQDYVETADEERGEVVKCSLNELGDIFVVGDDVARETLRGKVEIILE